MGYRLSGKDGQGNQAGTAGHGMGIVGTASAANEIHLQGRYDFLDIPDAGSNLTTMSRIPRSTPSILLADLSVGSISAPDLPLLADYHNNSAWPDCSTTFR